MGGEREAEGRGGASPLLFTRLSPSGIGTVPDLWCLKPHQSRVGTRALCVLSQSVSARYRGAVASMCIETSASAVASVSTKIDRSHSIYGGGRGVVVATGLRTPAAITS